MNTQINKVFLIILIALPIIGHSQDDFEVNGKRNQTHTYSNNTGVTSTELEYRGKIIFTDDETDVKFISAGGFLKFSKKSFGNRRTIILEGQAQGEITREYREGSRKISFEPEGRNWMASVLPEIIRSTGIGADERVKKFYKKGGIEAVLDEISLLPSNYVQSKYYSATFKLSGLSSSEIVKVVNDAGDEISSSYELSKILTKNSSTLTKDDQTMRAAISVVEEISSSYEQAKVYKHYLSKADLTDANKTLIIKGVREISSSYEKSGVLVTLLKDDLSDENVTLVLSEVAYISSSYEQSKVLQYLIKNQSTDHLDFDVMLKTISKISSSYEQGKVLKQLVSGRSLSSLEIVAVAKAAEYISSDYEQSKFLQSLINEQNLDTDGINAILAMTDEISSSYEKSKILQLIISSDNFNTDNIAPIIKETTAISSSYEQSKVLAKIIKNNGLADKHMLVLIDAIDDVSSSYEKSKLLQALGPKLPEIEEIRDAFFEVAKSLSDYEYGKVMRVVH